MKKFYITTPLYYVNDQPHIGHAYTTILADVIARFHRSRGEEVYFLTGTDEHGQKVQHAAEKRGVDPQKHVDEYVHHFLDMWDKLQIRYDGFIRTTEKRHIDRVKDVLNDFYRRGEFYTAEYEGLYSVSEERFVTEKEVEEGGFREVIHLKEKNYFFKMSKYQDALIRHIEEHPDFIIPSSRRNEILGFLKKPLGDLCISRPKSRLKWGIELPFDTDYVTYVWFDALLNYITAIGWKADDAMFKELWPVDYHLLGKDIITTHAVYWTTMLMALGLPLPKSILAHGWWLTDGNKMSKSLGNVVRPLDLVDEYGVDPVRYFLMRDMVLGLDSTFSMDAFIRRYNSDLANDFGNLINRVTIMIKKHFEGKIPEPGPFDAIDLRLIDEANQIPGEIKNLIDELKISDAIETAISLFRKLNVYLEKKAPWKAVKADPSQGGTAATTLYVSSNILQIGARLLEPVMPSKIEAILQLIGVSSDCSIGTQFGSLRPGSVVGEDRSPFPRILADE